MKKFILYVLKLISDINDGKLLSMVILGTIASVFIYSIVMLIEYDLGLLAFGLIFVGFPVWVATLPKKK